MLLFLLCTQFFTTFPLYISYPFSIIDIPYHTCIYTAGSSHKASISYHVFIPIVLLSLSLSESISNIPRSFLLLASTISKSHSNNVPIIHINHKVFQKTIVLTLHCIGIDFTDVLACACRVGNTNALLCMGSILVIVVIIDHDLSSSEEVSNILHLFLKTCRERARTMSSTTNSLAIMRR